MNPLISVLIPAYNIESRIGICLDSVLNNSYKNLEIICINDGSTDRTLEILTLYSNKDSRIIVVSQENKGVSYTRNELLHRASGEYIAYIDGDDVVHRQYFEVLLNTALTTNADVVMCRYMRYSNALPEPQPISNYLDRIVKYQGKDLSDNANQLLSMVATHLYKSTMIKGRLFNPSLSILEDTTFNLELLADYPSLIAALIPETMYYYFQRPNSIVHTTENLGFRMSEYYYLETEKCTGWKQYVFATKAIKTLLNARYESIISNNGQDIRKLTAMLRKAYSVYRINEFTSYKTKYAYFLFVYFPVLYRRFRITRDPTLVEWEKTQRSKFYGNT